MLVVGILPDGFFPSVGAYEAHQNVKKGHQTTNLRVGRSNRSGRAIYLIHISSISRAVRNGRRLKFAFSLGFSLGKFYLDADQTVDMPTDRRDRFRVADVRWADAVRPQRLDRRTLVNGLLTVAA